MSQLQLHCYDSIPFMDPTVRWSQPGIITDKIGRRADRQNNKQEEQERIIYRPRITIQRLSLAHARQARAEANATLHVFCIKASPLNSLAQLSLTSSYHHHYTTALHYYHHHHHHPKCQYTSPHTPVSRQSSRNYVLSPRPPAKPVVWSRRSPPFSAWKRWLSYLQCRGQRYVISTSGDDNHEEGWY